MPVHFIPFDVVIAVAFALLFIGGGVILWNLERRIKKYALIFGWLLIIVGLFQLAADIAWLIPSLTSDNENTVRLAFAFAAPILSILIGAVAVTAMPFSKQDSN
jgi:hypothetical protein